MTHPVKSLAIAVYENVSGEIHTEKGTITIGNMTKVINAVNSAQGKEMPQSEAIASLATSLVEAASVKNDGLGQLATGLGNMSVAKDLSFRTLVNLKIAGKKMRGVGVGLLETFKSYLSAAVVKLGFGIKVATLVEAAKTPEEAKEIIRKAGEEEMDPAKKAAAERLAAAETPEDVEGIVGQTPGTPVRLEKFPGEVGNTSFAKQLKGFTRFALYDNVKNDFSKKGLTTVDDHFAGQLTDPELKNKRKAMILSSLYAKAYVDAEAPEGFMDGLINALKKELHHLSAAEKKYLLYYLGAEEEGQDYSQVMDVIKEANLTAPDAPRSYRDLNTLFEEGHKAGQQVIHELLGEEGAASVKKKAAEKPAEVKTPVNRESGAGETKVVLIGKEKFPSSVINNHFAQILKDFSAPEAYAKVRADFSKLDQNIPKELKKLGNTGKAIFLAALIALAHEEKDEKVFTDLIHKFVPALRDILFALSSNEIKYLTYYIGAEEREQDFNEVMNDVVVGANLAAKGAERRYRILNDLFKTEDMSAQQVLQNLFSKKS